MNIWLSGRFEGVLEIWAFKNGSLWRKVPIPGGLSTWHMYGASFEPVCEESAACRASVTRVSKLN